MSDGEDALVFQVRALKLPAPVRELQFHPGRKWRFDLAWPDHLLAVEVEGGTFVAGRHNRGASFAHDCVKYCEAVVAGWRVLRVTTDMVDDGTAVAFVERALGLTGPRVAKVG